MLFHVYLFALTLGGVLLGASILLGGKDVDGDAGGGTDLDKGLDKAVDKAIDKGVGDATGDLFFWILSFRFWTFFLTFFGLTGSVLHGFRIVRFAPVSLALSIGMGLAVGIGASAIIRRLARDGANSAADSADYVGQIARVLVPVEKGGTGKVRLELKGTVVDVLASTDEPGEIAAGTEVLVIEMREARAVVARLTAARGGTDG